MTKYEKIPILHHIDANGHTCVYENKTLVGSIDILEVTLTACCNLDLFAFFLSQNRGSV